MENRIILEQIKELYPNIKILNISGMKGLSSSKIFLVHLNSGKKIIFKIYPKDYRERLQKEINILKELESYKIPSPKLIFFNMEKLLLIEEYIEGKLLFEEINKKDFNPDIMLSVGKELAKLHGLPVKEVWQDSNKINNEENWIKSVQNRNNANLKGLKENKVISLDHVNFFSKYLNNFIMDLKNTKIFLCPIHGDYNPKNILIEGLNVKGIFDFEIHRVAHNLNDLGIVYYWYRFYDKKELFSSFLEGYSEIIQITENDLKLIKVYYIMQVIGALSFLIKNNLDKEAVIILLKLLNEFFEKNEKNDKA